MSVSKQEVPAQLKIVFNRTEFQSRENKKARKLDPTIPLDGVEVEYPAIHFPKEFFPYTLIQKEWIRLQLVHGTRGRRRRADQTFIEGAKKVKPTFAYGYQVEGTHKRDMFFQIAEYGMSMIENEQDEAKREKMINEIVESEPPVRSIGKKVDGVEPIITTQTPIKISKELYDKVHAFQEEHNMKNRANIFYYLCLLALKHL